MTEDLFGFTEEDAKSNFFEPENGRAYVMTINGIEQKESQSGNTMFVFNCIVNEGKEGDEGQKHNETFFVNELGNKQRFTFSVGLFGRDELIAGKVKREDFIGVKFSCVARGREHNGKTYFSLKNVKRVDDVPEIEGVSSTEEAISKGLNDGAGSELCF